MAEELVKIIWVGGHDTVTIAATGLEVVRGEPVEVAAWLAGRAPSGDPEGDDYDPGEGLLAQPLNWQLAAKGKPSKSTPDAPAVPAGE